MTIDDTPPPGTDTAADPADKDELMRRVEAKTEAVRAEAATDSPPAKKATRKAAAKKATPAAGEAPATPAKRARKSA